VGSTVPFRYPPARAAQLVDTFHGDPAQFEYLLKYSLP
jgi:hypothetical protein